MSSLSLRIRQARRASHLTQEELAIRLGVGRTAVAQWERSGGSSPAAAKLAKLAVVLQCSFEWLATGRGARYSAASHHQSSEDAAVLRYFARDDEEETLLSTFRDMDAWDRGFLLQIATTIADRARAPLHRKRTAT